LISDKKKKERERERERKKEGETSLGLYGFGLSSFGLYGLGLPGFRLNGFGCPWSFFWVRGGATEDKDHRPSRKKKKIDEMKGRRKMSLQTDGAL